MARFHPEVELLVEYAAGRSDWAASICIAAHLHFCPSCRDKVASLNQIGGHWLTRAEPVDVSADCLAATLATVKGKSAPASSTSKSGLTALRETDATTRPQVAENARSTHRAGYEQLPPVLQKLVPASGKLPWAYAAPSLKVARLVTGQDKYEVCFHKIKKGGTVSEHDHRGRELTLVLEGQFSDENGTYSVGDFIAKQPGEKHRPTATLDQDCLCLSAVEAPVRLTGVFTRLLNPFLRVRPG